MAEHSAPDHKHRPAANSAAPLHSRAGAGGGLSGGLSQPAGWQSLLSFTILFLAWLAGFSSRLFAVIRFESIIHEFDPWSVAAAAGRDGEAGKHGAARESRGFPPLWPRGRREGPAARPPLRHEVAPLPVPRSEPAAAAAPGAEEGGKEREMEAVRTGHAVAGRREREGSPPRRGRRKAPGASGGAGRWGVPCGGDLGIGAAAVPRIPWSCGRTLGGARKRKLWRWQGIGSQGLVAKQLCQA